MGHDAAERRAREAGFDEHLTTPMNIAMLDAVV
jgi:hypothetical protein